MDIQAPVMVPYVYQLLDGEVRFKKVGCREVAGAFAIKHIALKRQGIFRVAIGHDVW
ncbi:hypothetical protein PENSPDRAFT_658234 [Peniophora sp. CONT]|nr:hypothetical protein PENSPDRAFT_658234 [Peniophora sp. CONT]